MAQERLSTSLPLDACASESTKRAKTAPSRQRSTSAAVSHIASEETNILREARRWRDEWRRHRYSRLKTA
jgi:hypothetical protein